MTVEAQIEVLQLQAKEHQGLPANHQKLGRDSRRDSPLQISEGTWTCQHLDFKLLASKTMKQ